MKTIDLSQIAAKGYSYEEVKNAFSEGSDIRYALEKRLFFFDTEFAYSANMVRFLDGTELRILGTEDGSGYGYVGSGLYPGAVCYRPISNKINHVVLTVKEYNRIATHRYYDYDGRNYTLATITDVYHLSLTSADKKAVYDIMSESAKCGGRYKSLHEYVLAAKRKAKKEAQKKEAQKKSRAREKVKKERERAKQVEKDLKKVKRERIKRERAAEKRGDNRFARIMRYYRTYEHVDGYKVSPNEKENRITSTSYLDWNGYSKNTKYPMEKHAYTLRLRRGFHFDVIGGILTMWYGKYNRTGMACEWIEQKRYEFFTVKGYIVRGEHIEAKSLKEAISINNVHRAKMLQDALKRLTQQRQQRIYEGKRRAEWEKIHAERIEQAQAYMNNVITFDDSLESGNCRPGTQNFKDNVIAALGHDVETLTVKEIIPLAIRFNQTYSVQRIFNYKGWKVNIDDFR